MERAVLSFPVLSGGVVAALFFTTLAGAAGPPVTMVDPQWQPVTDAQGVSWMIDQQSNLRVNSGRSMLMAVGTLTNNGGQFSPNRVLMTPDGTEYVFEGSLNNVNGPNGDDGPMVQIVRRIKINRQSSTLRFVESVQNTGATPVQVTMTTGSATVRSQIQSVVCGPSGTALQAATGQAVTGPPGGGIVPAYRPGAPSPYGVPNNGMVRLALPAHDCGVVVRSHGNRLPGVWLYAPQSKHVKPAIDIQNYRTLQVSFTLAVPAQSTVSVVWGLADRTLPAALDAQAIKKQFKVFQDREWLADLPDNVIKSIVNYRRFNSGESALLGPLLQPVLDLAAQYDVERGKADVLVQDEQSRMLGAVAGSDLSIATSLGKAVVPLEEVALLSGGAGVERPMRVYLRNGEILVGRVEAKDLVLKAPAGVDAKLSPEEINLLFLHAAGNDGKTAAEAQAMVETHDGQRLLLSGAPGTPGAPGGAPSTLGRGRDAQFHAVTPWGGLDFGLGEIDRLSVRREPQPVYRLTFKDGSDLSVLLQGELPPLKSLRFGPVKPSAGVWQLWSLQTPGTMSGTMYSWSWSATQQSQQDQAGDQEQPAGPAGPHCRLIGENVLAGTIETPKVNLATAGSVLAIPLSQIRTAQRSGDPQAGGPINVELTDGRHLSGLLTNRTVAIRFHGKVWEVSAQHLIAIDSGKRAVAAPSPGPAAANPGKAATTKDGGILPAVETPARPANPGPGPVPTPPPLQPVPTAPLQPVPTAPLQPVPTAPLQPAPTAPLQPAPTAPVQAAPAAPPQAVPVLQPVPSLQPIPPLPLQPAATAPVQPIPPLLPDPNPPPQTEDDDPFLPPPEQSTVQPAPVQPAVPAPVQIDDNPFG